MGCYMSKNADSKENRIGRWISTGIVSLRDRKVRELPNEIFEVARFVRTLDLTENKIAEIQPEISKLINLQRLVLANNLIERLPSSLGSLKSLKVLKLDGNQITTLPNELGLLSKLERLSVSKNMLTFLPNTIGGLHNLLLLNISDNNLRSLPETIGSCVFLEELLADGNSIEDLPSSVCELKNLKSLSLNNNKIHQLPRNLLKDCKALQSISLHENPITTHHFEQMEGFEDFETRRRKKLDKQIDSNVMMSSARLDEGVDRR